MKIDDDFDIAVVRFPTALRVVTVFKYAAMAVVVLTVIGAFGVVIGMNSSKDFVGDPMFDAGEILRVLIAEVVVGVLTAAFLGFFAYTLEVLLEIYSEVWAISVEVVPDDEDDSDS